MERMGNLPTLRSCLQQHQQRVGGKLCQGQPGWQRGTGGTGVTNGTGDRNGTNGTGDTGGRGGRGTEVAQVTEMAQVTQVAEGTQVAKGTQVAQVPQFHFPAWQKPGLPKVPASRWGFRAAAVKMGFFHFLVYFSG